MGKRPKQKRLTALGNSEIGVSRINGFVLLPFFPRWVEFLVSGPGRGEEPKRGNILRLIRDPLTDAEFGQITPVRQDNLVHTQRPLIKFNNQLQVTRSSRPINWLLDEIYMAATVVRGRLKRSSFD